MTTESSARERVFAVILPYVCALPFETVEFRWNELFDNLKDIDTASVLEFLKSTSVGDVIYEVVDDGSHLKLTNGTSQKSFYFAYRSTGFELRGPRIINIIDLNRNNGSNQTLLELFNNHLQNTTNSYYLEGPKIVLTRSTRDKNISSFHYDLLVRLILQKINQKIVNGAIKTVPNPKDIVKEGEEVLRKEILEGIDINALYDLAEKVSKYETMNGLMSNLLINNPKFLLGENSSVLPILLNLSQSIDKLQIKQENLSKRKCDKEAQLLHALITGLNTELASFIESKTDKQTFIQNCKSKITTAQGGDLAKERGVGKILVFMLNLFTLGTASLLTKRFSVFRHHTDSINKIGVVDEKLNDVDSSPNNKN